MSTLAWVRLDTGFPRNHKVLALMDQKDGPRAAFVYVCSLAFCGEQGTDGFIPAPGLTWIHGRKKDAEALVEVGLWTACPGGWMIHDWREYQPSHEESERRTARAKAAAEARWSRNRDARSNARSNAPRNASVAMHGDEMR